MMKKLVKQGVNTTLNVKYKYHGINQLRHSFPQLTEMAYIPQVELSRIHHPFSCDTTVHQHRNVSPRTPVDKPLSVNVNIEYKMDTSKFEYPTSSQPALLIHPSHLHMVFMSTAPFWAVQIPFRTSYSSYCNVGVPYGYNQTKETYQKHGKTFKIFYAFDLLKCRKGTV